MLYGIKTITVRYQNRGMWHNAQGGSRVVYITIGFNTFFKNIGKRTWDGII